MQKGKTRQNKGTAVLRFFICLLILIIIVIVAVFLLNRGKNAGDRPYIATGTGVPATAVPVATLAATAAPTVPLVTVTPAPTAAPTPTPTPVPTVAPTPIPATALSVMRTDYSLPAEGNDGDIGISRCYVSAIDGYKIMQLEGWGYTDKEYFNGEECGTYLMVFQDATGRSIAYLTANEEGVSGVPHTGTLCKNPSACDWVAYIDVSGYAQGTYSLGLVLCYKNETKDAYSFYRFGALQSFTVKDGEIINPVTVSTAQ